MKAFKILIDLYEVDDYMGCATSAMREAKNGAELIKEVEEDIKLKIKIIDGATEALLINNAITSFLDKRKNYLHIDVGGGSTELTIIKGGEKAISKSFKVGSVRRLEHHDSPQMWAQMKKWIVDQTTKYEGVITSIGTGGNINKLFELALKHKGEKMTLTQLKDVQKFVRKLSIEDRINELQLNPDRADVIIPASEIYIAVMEWAKSKSIIVPEVGLKDGIMQHLYLRNTQKEKIKFI
jgi:exopolyphosphatase/guanosine-5'-triphosphate,3'-diphosphate pyrophosphatase